MYRVKAVNFLSMDMDHDECVFWTLFNAVINSHTHSLNVHINVFDFSQYVTGRLV